MGEKNCRDREVNFFTMCKSCAIVVQTKENYNFEYGISLISVRKKDAE